MLVGLMELQVSPDGRGVSDRDTVPANPFRLATLKVAAPVWPTRTGTVVEEAEMLKSSTLTDTLIEWESVPADKQSEQTDDAVTVAE